MTSKPEYDNRRSALAQRFVQVAERVRSEIQAVGNQHHDLTLSVCFEHVHMKLGDVRGQQGRGMLRILPQCWPSATGSLLPRCRSPW